MSLCHTEYSGTHIGTSKQDTFSHPKYHSCNKDTSLTMTLSSGPLVSGLERFHCTLSPEGEVDKDSHQSSGNGSDTPVPSEVGRPLGSQEVLVGVLAVHLHTQREREGVRISMCFVCMREGVC